MVLGCLLYHGYWTAGWVPDGTLTSKLAHGTRGNFSRLLAVTLRMSGGGLWYKGTYTSSRHRRWMMASYYCSAGAKLAYSSSSQTHCVVPLLLQSRNTHWAPGIHEAVFRDDLPQVVLIVQSPSLYELAMPVGSRPLLTLTRRFVRRSSSVKLLHQAQPTGAW